MAVGRANTCIILLLGLLVNPAGHRLPNVSDHSQAQPGNCHAPLRRQRGSIPYSRLSAGEILGFKTHIKVTWEAFEIVELVPVFTHAEAFGEGAMSDVT